MPSTVTLYQDANFSGASLTIQSSVADLSQFLLGESNWTDQVSSIRVTGAPITAYQDVNFGGEALVFVPGDYAQFTPAWNDVISSISLS
ncbi:conserved protein of unknown function [Rhodovastum atsumiense]|uniref:Beta/gamma crystallin 'Greek key' domain-containing protein n=1 Tax=Rhodovastum atsumiense TaxID=504468 RepID=A0A5M6IWP2_9PROT|nr:hypothetical protein F1189_08370 [Rhodovastum atsumiense]CAH2602702.1 conserved protein of unknown function [Rhodovastum atsumiense]